MQGLFLLQLFCLESNALHSLFSRRRRGNEGDASWGLSLKVQGGQSGVAMVLPMQDDFPIRPAAPAETSAWFLLASLCPHCLASLDSEVG